MSESFIPILILIVFGLALGLIMVGLAYFVGPKQRTVSKLSPYEGGVPLLDVSRKRINVRFYQIAMLFILFDIEAAFIYPWAVIYRDATVSGNQIVWFALIEMLVFISLLAVGYIYVWKKKAFDWK